MKVSHGLLFMTENFHDFLSVQHFFNKAVYRSQIDLLSDIIFSRQFRKFGCHKKHDKSGQDRNYCQYRIQNDHRNQSSKHSDDRIGDLRDTLA